MTHGMLEINVVAADSISSVEFSLNAIPLRDVLA